MEAIICNAKIETSDNSVNVRMLVVRYEGRVYLTNIKESLYQNNIKLDGGNDIAGFSS